MFSMAIKKPIVSVHHDNGIPTATLVFNSESIISRRTVSFPIRKFMLPEKASLFPRTDFMLPEKASLVLQREFMLPEKASLVPFRT